MKWVGKKAGAGGRHESFHCRCGLRPDPRVIHDPQEMEVSGPIP